MGTCSFVVTFALPLTWSSLIIYPPPSPSMQLAEEVLKSGPFPGEEEAGNSPGFEGMEALARAIELG